MLCCECRALLYVCCAVMYYEAAGPLYCRCDVHSGAAAMVYIQTVVGFVAAANVQ